MAKWQATSATAGPRSRVATSCQPSRQRAGCRGESKRSPARSVRSIPPTNASSPSTTIVFSWWQWTGCSRGSISQRMRVSRVSSATFCRTSPRVGWKAGSGAPAHTSTRTSIRSASSASSEPTTTGDPPRTSSKPGSRCQPVMCTERLAPASASAIAGSASAPSISTSSALPGRGGGSPAAQIASSGGSRARAQPSFCSRRRCFVSTAASTTSPTLASRRLTRRPATGPVWQALGLVRRSSGRCRSDSGQPASPCVQIGGGTEHARTAAVDDADAVLPAVLGGGLDTLPAPGPRCIQTCLMPSSAHSRIVVSAVSGLVAITTASTPPGIEARSW